jgi:uncharacterized protein (DUF58 family)
VTARRVPDPDVVWRPTAAHLRALGVGAALALLAVVTARVDVLLVGGPLLAVALWGQVLRPSAASGRRPVVRVLVSPDRLRESPLDQPHLASAVPDAALWCARVEPADGVEHGVAVLDHDPWLLPRTATPSTGRGRDEEPTLALSTPVRALRWGVHRAGPAQVALTSAWAAYRYLPRVTHERSLVVTPQPAAFDADAPAPHPNGLVGPDRGRRIGDGAEFAGIRPFQLGDRLRRVHWPVSQRTGTLQVVTTYADQDSEVVLVVDALSSVGGGPDAARSSLTTSVRAATALAEHHLRRGDRVGLTTLGGVRPVRVPPRAGRRHLLRVLEALTTVEPHSWDRLVRARLGLGVRAGSLVLAVSPLLDDELTGTLLTLASRGLTVVAVDTLPPPADLGPEDLGLGSGPAGAAGGSAAVALAWRLRLLERAAALRRLQEAGIAVVAWRGPGSLDVVLRQIGARGGRPRAVRR